MSEKIFVKPKKPELIVLKPDGSRLKAAGEYVAAEVYWQRRINDNEVEVQKQPKKKGN